MVHARTFFHVLRIIAWGCLFREGTGVMSEWQRQRSGMAVDHRMLARAPAQLPSEPALDFTGLTITAPRLRKVTAKDLLDRLQDKLREDAGFRERREGEAVEAGDDVQVDCLAYARGKLVPMSAQVDVWWKAGEGRPGAPGLGEALVGARVGSSGIVTARLSDEATLSGKEVRFHVDVKAARAWKAPPREAPEDSLRRLGLGQTPGEGWEAIAREIRKEREQRLRSLLCDKIADALIERVTVDVPPALVETQLVRRWAAVEGKLLATKGLSNAEQQEALEGWLTNERLTQEEGRRLRLAIALQSTALRLGIAFPPERVKRFLISGDPVADLILERVLARSTVTLGEGISSSEIA
jgi:trigger factor